MVLLAGCFSAEGRTTHSPNATVVLAAYDCERWGDITRALAGLAAQVSGPFETILVIDHNPTLLEDARVELPPMLAGLRILENDRARGASGARNAGIAAATGDVVVLLDDDAYPEQSWLEELLAPFADHDVVATGGRLIATWPHQRPPWFPPEFDWVVGSSYEGMPKQAADIRNPIAASSAFRRQPTLEAGGFHEDVGRVGRTPLGCEETELAIRLRQRQPAARVRYVPSSVAHHRVPPWRTRPSYFLRRCYLEGRSKAVISRLVGRTDALDSEAAYVRSTLPGAVLAGLRDGLGGCPWGFARAATVLVGLSAAAAGFAAEQARWIRKSSA